MGGAPRYASLTYIAQHSTGGPVKCCVLVVLVLGVFAPVFIQAGSGLYAGGTYFNSGGDFALLPVPISVMVCCLVALLLGGYARVRLVLTVVLFTFMGLWLSTFVAAEGGMQGVDKSDLMLLVQYMIPVFALVLGAQLGGGEGALEHLARVVLGVVLMVISLQLVATWYNGELLLSSSAVLFGVYQHLQYVPVVLCGAFIIALYALWEDSRTHAWLLIAAGLAGRMQRFRFPCCRLSCSGVVPCSFCCAA